MGKKRAVVVLLFFIFFGYGCVTAAERNEGEYGMLGSAVSAASFAIIGELGDTIPEDFTDKKFMGLIEGKIPADYFEVLRRYSREVKPKGTYYLLLVSDPKTKTLVLFDYSCTAEPDGPILSEPGKYNIEHLELYDTCKQ